MGDFHISSENYSLALEYFEKAYKATQENGPQMDLWRLAFKVGQSYRWKGLLNEAREWLYLAQSRLAGHEGTIEYGMVLLHLGAVIAKAGAPEDGLRHCFQAYEILKNSSLHAEVAENLNNIAIIYTRLGYQQEAKEFFTDALVTHRRIDNHLGVAQALMNLGLLKKYSCDFEEALQLFEKSLALAKKYSLQGVQISLHLNSGIVYFKIGRDREAADFFTHARQLAIAAGDEARITRSTISLGRAHIRLGNHRRAELLLLEGRVLAEKNSLLRSVALADEFLGELAEARGDLEAAMANYDVAMDLATRIAPKGDVVVEILQRMARVKLAQGLPLDAIQLAAKGLKLAAGNGEFYEVPFLERTQARAWVRLENWKKADTAFQAALRNFDKISSMVEEDQTLFEYASFLFGRSSLEGILRARKILEDLLQNPQEDRTDHFLFKASLLLAQVEYWLGDLDRALLAAFDAEGYLPEDATRDENESLEGLRGDIERRKFAQSGDHFGFLPGNPDAIFSSGGREDLPENLQHAWESLFELCNADTGCLCMDGVEGEAFEFLEGMTRNEVKNLQESQREEGLDISSEILEPTDGEARTGFLYQPLEYSGTHVGFLCLWRKENREGFSREMIRYLAGFARMVTLIVFRDSRQSLRQTTLPSDLPEATQDIITQDPNMLNLLHLAGKVAETPAWVLLSGETGTGKGIFAYAIHRMSARRDQRFVHVNCAALPEELLESELFGHMKGSFTGAISDKPGLIEEANGGTLFLDEVGKTSLRMQAKLLQFLDTREIRRVGATNSVPVNVRLISATKTDLKELAKQGRFLEDLYYRLNDFPLRVPSLKDRKSDITLLAEYFLDRYSAEYKKKIPGFTKVALGKLNGFDWPGNVRELEKVVKRALLLTADKTAIGPESIILDGCILGSSRSQAPDVDFNMKRKVEELEKHLISKALDAYRWNRTHACQGLGISYPTILQKIRKYKLEP
ncbi:MAG: tetratricopeptide repeat protein [bacterium]|nr:tetratricopeptide repeat protein [bacterium]